MSVADDTMHVLLALRLRGAADLPTLDSSLAAMGVEIAELSALLSRLDLAGLVEPGPGATARWRLTADGRAEGERLLANELAATGGRDRVHDAYRAFLDLNGPLLRVCTDWQLRDDRPASIVVNDHRDPAYDAEVLQRLAAIRDGVRPVLRELGDAVPRLSHYEHRLGDAADVDAFHAVWFELHEDLLSTLGLDRSTEPLPNTDRRPPAPDPPGQTPDGSPPPG